MFVVKIDERRATRMSRELWSLKLRQEVETGMREARLAGDPERLYRIRDEYRRAYKGA